jgi:hypothetical protein
VSFVHVLGGRATGAIEAMGSDRYRVRELGASVLVSLPEPERLRALAWGMAHPSVEVRAACGRMAVALYECKHCHGTHICPVVAENEASGYTRLCDECGGLWDHCRRCR